MIGTLNTDYANILHERKRLEAIGNMAGTVILNRPANGGRMIAAMQSLEITPWSTIR